jgi:histidinol-phosphate aminotransferase
MKVKLPVRRAILQRQRYETPAEGRFGKVRLDFNENTSGCSPAVLRALAKLSAKKLAMYPEYAGTTQKLARHYGVDADELLMTNGGDEAIRVFFDSFVDAGSHILICEPTFPMYRYFGEIADARVDTVSYGTKMEFPRKALFVALKKRPRVLFIANPNNPTGTLISIPEIKRILDASPNTAVVIDEAYAEFSGVTVLPLIRKYPNLFVTRTFSKAAGIAGLRLGLVMGCAESVGILRRAMAPFAVNVAVLVAAEAAVGDAGRIKTIVRNTRRVREWFAKELGKMGAKRFPSAGNFLLVDFGPRGLALVRKLEAKGILLRGRKDGFVRITIGTSQEMKLVTRKLKALIGKGAL